VHALVVLPTEIFSRIDGTWSKPPLAGALSSVSLLATKLNQVVYAGLYNLEDWGVKIALEDAPSSIASFLAKRLIRPSSFSPSRVLHS
jgi:hypothetical protein